MEESSDEEWHEIEVPEIEVKKKTVEVRIEKKKPDKKAQEEKAARLEAERNARWRQEDLHRVTFRVDIKYLFSYFSLAFWLTLRICAIR
jgi:hypothetical protein